MDTQIGRLADFLRERGQLDNTLWVIVSDHGESFHERGLVTHGKSLRENETRVPLLFHWPNRVKARDVWLPVSTLDILPTVVDLLGLPSHPAHQGLSFASLQRHRHARRPIFQTLQGLRYADAIVCWPYKLVHDATAAQLLLFDLEQDPAEQHNRMSREHPAARPLSTMLLAHIKRQLAYHDDTHAMQSRFAPRLPRCPTTP